MRRWRFPATVAIAGLVLGLCASSASASFLYYRSTHSTIDLVYAGLTNGERNVVTEQLSGGELLYTEVGGPLITSFPAMCHAITPIQVACATEGAPAVRGPSSPSSCTTTTISPTRARRCRRGCRAAPGPTSSRGAAAPT